MSILTTQDIVDIDDVGIVDACTRLAMSLGPGNCVPMEHTLGFRRYVMLWPLARGLRGVVIGQSPYSHDVFPFFSSAFSYEGCELTPSVRVIAHDQSVTTGRAAEQVAESIRVGFLLVRKGVIFVNESVSEASGSLPSFIESSKQCEVLAALAYRAKLACPGKYVLSIIAFGRRAANMGNLLKSSLSNLNVAARVHTIKHPAYYARLWGSPPYKQSNVMLNPVASRTLSSLLVVDDSVATPHSSRLGELVMSRKSAQAMSGTEELKRIVEEYTSAVLRAAKSRSSELNAIADEADIFVGHVSDLNLQAQLRNFCSVMRKFTMCVEELGGDMMKASAKFGLDVSMADNTALTRAVVSPVSGTLGRGSAGGSQSSKATAVVSGSSKPATTASGWGNFQSVLYFNLVPDLVSRSNIVVLTDNLDG